MADDSIISDYIGSQASNTLFGGSDSTGNIVNSDAIFSSENDVNALSGPMSSTSAFNTTVGGVGSILGGVGQLLSAGVYRQEAKAFDTAAAETGWQVGVKHFEMGTKINEIIGTQTSQLAAAGFTAGGSSQYLLKSAVGAGGLAQGQISQNAQITEQQYEQQAKAANTQAENATIGGIGGIGLGIAGIVGGFLGL